MSMLHRLILWLAVIGMALSLHLHIQEERHFDRGCWGFGQGLPAGDCLDPALRRASVVLGIPLSVWGYGFYFATAMLGLAQGALSGRGARLGALLSETLAAIAFPCAAYLVFFQGFVAHAFCPLCLVSAGLIAGIFILRVALHLRGGAAAEDARRAPEAAHAAGLVLAAAGGMAAMLVFVDQVGAGGPPAAQAAQPARPAPALKMADWIGPSTPHLGSVEGVPVVAFFDPNCPHCGGVFASVSRLAERYRSRACFYVFPRVLWDFSVPQVEALDLAAERGKYFEMWRVQFERQRRGGLSRDEIAGIARELGLAVDGLDARLAAAQARVQASRDKARAAGINSTPTIFIDGRFVEGSERAEERMAALIEKAAAAREADRRKAALAAAAR